MYLVDKQVSETSCIPKRTDAIAFLTDEGEMSLQKGSLGKMIAMRIREVWPWCVCPNLPEVSV